MKIAIIYIALGNYIKFWNEFYKSCEFNFLIEDSKHYFLFTNEVIEKKNNVDIIFQEDMGWPYNTLNRFHMIDKIKDDLKSYDYIYFFNSNYKFLEKISREEFFPNKENNYLINLAWERINKNKNIKFPYERNKKSEAYISFKNGKFYYQGGMSGGRNKEFLKLVDECKKMIDKDSENKIIAKNNDESYLNKYLLKYPPKIVNEEYGMPEEWTEIDKKIKMILRDKNIILGIQEIKKQKGDLYSLKKRISNKILEFYYRIRY